MSGSKKVTDFVESWIQEKVNATSYDDTSEAKALAHSLVIDAGQHGISAAQLRAEYGDLSKHLLGILNSRADEEVERLANKDE